MNTTTRQNKLIGVWADGKLMLQSKDRAKVDEAADMWMRQRRSVWVAPIGSFVWP